MGRLLVSVYFSICCGCSDLTDWEKKEKKKKKKKGGGGGEEGGGVETTTHQ